VLTRGQLAKQLPALIADATRAPGG
jgi:hypothetical protein